MGPFPVWLGLVKPERGWPQLTCHYPREVIADEDLVTFRGPVELVPDGKDPARSKCISCQMCVRACPGNCLTVVKGDEGKAPKLWTSDFTLCCLCGACVEVCPASALRFSHDIYWTARTREEMIVDLLAKLAGRAAEKGGRPHA
ncbi:MAG: 4Fe-4S binding protein [Candidatus Adiutrix sp.]|nr:4Fe-4S binding protein [Candidatus Adiutrix sp.]